MLAQTIRRVLKAPRLRQRSAEGYLNLIRNDHEVDRDAILLAHYGRRHRSLIRALLHDLWRLDTTALYVQVDAAASGATLVVSRRTGHYVVASGQKFRAEIQTHEPAPNGAYRTEKQYRQLGFYEYPPSERIIVTARIRAGTGKLHVVDVPNYVSHVTAVINDRILAAAAPIPATADLRFELR